MRISETKIVDMRIEKKIIIVDDYDDNGDIIGNHEETIEEKIPIYGTVYRDETEEEKADREEQERHQYDGFTYEQLVSMFIRERYSLDEELALHRQRDTKVEEFEIYNSYCEDCKVRAREIKN